MALIVTGAAGFIGSNLVKALNARGERDIIAVDNLARADKVANLADLEITDFVDKRDFLKRMPKGADLHNTCTATSMPRPSSRRPSKTVSAWILPRRRSINLSP